MARAMIIADMILISLFTQTNKKENLDRYYLKMRTPVIPDAEADKKRLEAVFQDPETAERKQLFPGTV